MRLLYTYSCPTPLPANPASHPFATAPDAAATAAVTRFAEIKAMGIDVIMDYRYPNDPSFGIIMDGAAANGLKVLINCQPWTHFVGSTGDFGGYCAGNNQPDYTGLLVVINQWKDHPALYGYYCDDETSGSVYNITTRVAVYDFIKAADPNPAHVVYEAHYDFFPTAYAPYEGKKAHDIYGIDNYPYSPNPPYAGTEEHNLAEYQAVLHKFVPYKSVDTIFPILQAFSDGGFWTVPSGSQAKMWARVQAEGLDTVGAMWFIWWPGNTTWPQTIDDSAYLPGEISAIAATIAPLVPPPPPPVEPVITDIMLRTHTAQGYRVIRLRLDGKEYPLKARTE